MLLTAMPPLASSKVSAADDVFPMVAAGGYHSLALKSDGTVLAWGDNANGQFGDGTNTSRNTPVQVSGLTGVVNIAAGIIHSLALKSDGTVWAWGYNGHGQLGDGTTTGRNTPVQVSGLTGVVDIAAGTYHSLALKSDGTVWVWGSNNYGQLGDGTTTNRNTPVQVSGLTGVVDIAAGTTHSLALKSDGTVWVWGYNGHGQLGDGTNTSRNTPVQVSGLTGVVNIAAGDVHSLALKSDGTVWAWGYNGYGQLGDGTTTNRNTPVQVSGLTGVVDIAAGDYHSLAIKSDGTVWVWGSNNYGQLGDGTTTDRNTLVQVSGLTGVVDIAAGINHSLAIKSDGMVWAWGRNIQGQLGDGTETDRSTPVQVRNSNATVFNIGPIPAKYKPTLTISASPQTGQYGQDATLTVTISGAYKLFGNYVTLSINGVSHSALTDTTGKATYTLTNPSIGNYTISASFAGNRFNDVAGASFNYSVGKAFPAVITTPTASNIYKGQTLSVSTLSGGVASVPGSFAWDAGATTPASSGSFAVIFTPADGANYETVPVSVALIVIDKDGLTNLISQASGILSAADVGEGNGQYPQSAYNTLSSAIIAAQVTESVSAASTTQSAMTDATSTLQSAVNAFNNSKIVISFLAIDAAIANAKAIEKGNYTDESYNALQQSIASAETVRAKANVTQAEVDVATSAISGAREALLEKSGSNLIWLWLGIVVVVVVVVSVCSTLLLRKRKA